MSRARSNALTPAARWKTSSIARGGISGLLASLRANGPANTRPLAPRNDVENFRYGSAISRRGSPEVLQKVSPNKSEGAGNAGCALHRRSRVQNCKKRTRAYRFSGGNPAFPAQWFYGLLRALPGDQACLTPSSARLLADLTPASGRQNDTTWPYASGRARLARCPRPPHPAPR